jgi:hypothetical protein
MEARKSRNQTNLYIIETDSNDSAQRQFEE